MSEELLFSKEEWDAAVPRVVAGMTDHLRPHRTAIYDLKEDYGEGWGSGSYLRLGDRVFILSNEHVARAREQGKPHSKILGHQFDGQEDIRAIVGNHSSYPLPLDLALLPVDMHAWAEPTNKSKAIEIGQISMGHDPVEGELLTFTGFAGEKVAFCFNTLFAEGTCYTAREIDLASDQRLSSRCHFGLDYRPEAASSVRGKSGLPLPPGLSGSTVWNTSFVAAKMQNIPWTPELARVTGVIWGWRSDHASLIATRAEFLRSFLLAVAEKVS
jgi:hypothetical protein